jgi:hypothetical protein
MKTIQKAFQQAIEIVEHVVIWLKNRLNTAHAC